MSVELSERVVASINMTTVVTGAAGQLGRDVQHALAASTTEFVPFGRADLDLTDATAVTRMLSEHAPAVVINCAAYTAVDDCETNEDLAHAVNEHAVRTLAQACRALGAHLLHVSTDYVFDGELDRPYVESDPTNPQSAYGRSKLAGEVAATEVLGDDVTIVRTSWVCGEHGNNMVKLVRHLAGSGAPMAFVDDQRGCPTFTSDLAPALLQLGEERLGGVFHLTNAGAVSWFDFVGDILEASGYNRSLVTPITTAELEPPRPAPRPANGELGNHRWAATGHEKLRHYREPLRELARRLA